MLLEAVVEAPFGLVRVMTTHLEYYSATQRAAQAETLRRLHAEACADARAYVELDSSEGTFRSMPRPASAIITGDFNFKPDDPLQALLQQPYGDGSVPLHDAWTARWPGVPIRRRWASTTATSGPKPIPATTSS